MGGVSFVSQLIGTLAGILVAVIGGLVVYGAIKAAVGIRLSEEDEYMGADLAIHKVSSSPDNESSW
jgi:Amt family ammonium transporter